jgi:hypothetical protein
MLGHLQLGRLMRHRCPRLVVLACCAGVLMSRTHGFAQNVLERLFIQLSIGDHPR